MVPRISKCSMEKAKRSCLQGLENRIHGLVMLQRAPFHVLISQQLAQETALTLMVRLAMQSNPGLDFLFLPFQPSASSTPDTGVHEKDLTLRNNCVGSGKV